MNSKILEKTPLFSAFSELGKRIYLPQGIFYWSERAKKEAELIGTIGAAYAYEDDFVKKGRSEWLPCYLEGINEYYKNLKINDLVPYAAISGISELRDIWKNWIIHKSLLNKKEMKEKLDRLKKYITTPIITTGVTNGIFLICSLLLNANEYIITPNKRWGNYDNIIKRFLGAKIKSFKYFKEQHFNFEGFEKAIDEITVIQDKILIIFNFPNNPTGHMPTKEEILRLIELLRAKQKEIKKPILVLIDDAYEPYIHVDNVLNRSFFYDLQELEEDIIPIKLDGATKELLLYGARIGFITIGLKPKWIKNDSELEILKNEIDNKLSSLIRSTISNCNHFYQALMVNLFNTKGFEGIIAMRKPIQNLLKERYLKINAELEKIKNPNISVDPNSGGFFTFININPNYVKANEFAKLLLTKYKVGVIPIEKPGENVNGVRIAYCSIDIAQIPKIVNRIKSALAEF
ncbi:MAG: aminotransferase class I/II-fold pyridoxal phosphate-dependent enzyme [Promethearchaeota archaeon]